MTFDPNQGQDQGQDQDQGRQTGTKRTRRSPDPRVLMKRLIGEAAHPHLPEEQEAICEEFKEQALAYPKMLGIIVDEWMQKNYRKLLADFPLPGKPPQHEPAAKAADVEKRTEALKEAVVGAVKQISLLDWKLANGKAFRDCTREECEELGSWMAKIVTRLEPGQLVGDVFKNDEEIRALFG
jgi:hypothetical protein